MRLPARICKKFWIVYCFVWTVKSIAFRACPPHCDSQTKRKWWHSCRHFWMFWSDDRSWTGLWRCHLRQLWLCWDRARTTPCTPPAHCSGICAGRRLVSSPSDCFGSPHCWNWWTTLALKRRYDSIRKIHFGPDGCAHANTTICWRRRANKCVCVEEFKARDITIHSDFGNRFWHIVAIVFIHRILIFGQLPQIDGILWRSPAAAHKCVGQFIFLLYEAHFWQFFRNERTVQFHVCHCGWCVELGTQDNANFQQFKWNLREMMIEYQIANWKRWRSTTFTWCGALRLGRPCAMCVCANYEESTTRMSKQMLRLYWPLIDRFFLLYYVQIGIMTNKCAIFWKIICLIIFSHRFECFSLLIGFFYRQKIQFSDRTIALRR